MHTSKLLFVIILIATVPSLLAANVTSFSATGHSREVQLHWEASEISDVVRFDVLRNGLLAMRIPVSGGDYTWSDREVQNDRPYTYTLTAVLADGRREIVGSVSAMPSFDAYTVDEYRLYQNYPNPFNPETTIEVDVAQDGYASLTVYDILGQKVAQPLSGNLARGKYSVLFDGRNLPSGVYLYQLQAGSFVDHKKMALLK